jgi:protoporphyrinogen/coproporphyrinogen III oxidase
LIEQGPNSTLETTPLLTRLIEDVGIGDQKLYASGASKHRYILRDGVLRPLPMSPPAFFRSKLFSASAKLRLFREPFIRPSPPDSEESVADFVRRRLGSEFLDYAINPFVAGVYAGDPALLSVRAAFPKLFELEQKWGGLIKGQIRGARERKRRGEADKQHAKMFSFVEGMQTLTDAIAERLQRKYTHAIVAGIGEVCDGGRAFSLEVSVDGQTRRLTAGSVVIATPADEAARLSSGLVPGITGALQAIPYPPVAEVLTGFRPTPGMHSLEGFGFLIPAVERRSILGTIFSSSIFHSRAPEGHILLTTFVGGSRQPEEARRPESDILLNVLKEQHALLGTPMETDFSHVTVWPRAIPQYVHGHIVSMTRLDEAERSHQGLYFCANYRGGISVGDCVKSAHAVAERIIQQRGAG